MTKTNIFTQAANNQTDKIRALTHKVNKDPKISAVEINNDECSHIEYPEIHLNSSKVQPGDRFVVKDVASYLRNEIATDSILHSIKPTRVLLQVNDTHMKGVTGCYGNIMYERNGIVLSNAAIKYEHIRQLTSQTFDQFIRTNEINMLYALAININKLYDDGSPIDIITSQSTQLIEHQLQNDVFHKPYQEQLKYVEFMRYVDEGLISKPLIK